MKTILGIDPGTERSAYVLYDGTIIDKGILFNDNLLQEIAFIAQHRGACIDLLAVEMVASYGMAVGRTVFETCVWIGRFIQAVKDHSWAEEWQYVYRKDVKIHLCNSMRAKDSNIRQALMDRYGSTRQAAIGVKANPGPLYGFSKDMWSALAIAITAHEGKK
ncbi:MAG: hypothetical protein ABGX83_05345 [Nitrospira sp.]